MSAGAAAGELADEPIAAVVGDGPACPPEVVVALRELEARPYKQVKKPEVRELDLNCAGAVAVICAQRLLTRTSPRRVDLRHAVDPEGPLASVLEVAALEVPQAFFLGELLRPHVPAFRGALCALEVRELKVVQGGDGRRARGEVACGHGARRVREHTVKKRLVDAAFRERALELLPQGVVLGHAESPQRAEQGKGLAGIEAKRSGAVAPGADGDAVDVLVGAQPLRVGGHVLEQQEELLGLFVPATEPALDRLDAHVVARLRERGGKLKEASRDVARPSAALIRWHGRPP